MKITPIISFGAYKRPENFKQIDNNVMRSAQPEADEIVWLKDNKNLTDIINFRTMYVRAVDFDEEELSKALNIKYHSIPTISKSPEKENVKEFLDIINDIKEKNGKVLIHCKAGADRTGFYSFIYEVLNGCQTKEEAEKEMLKMGHNKERYPDLIQLAYDYTDELKDD